MFPSSPNVQLTLIKVVEQNDLIGNQYYQFISKRSVIGISKSITSKEYYESKRENYKMDMSVKINSFLYDGSKYTYINGKVYQIERTYISGQFIELYLMETRLGLGDFVGYTG